jgi:hypothetical protein
MNYIIKFIKDDTIGTIYAFDIATAEKLFNQYLQQGFYVYMYNNDTWIKEGRLAETASAFSNV